mgnify:CR=1 FL=1|tara:strand:+ start:1865 stop:2206 length:342 start_codon:yes stop_codon:yes gene_type:complete
MSNPPTTQRQAVRAIANEYGMLESNSFYRSKVLELHGWDISPKTVVEAIGSRAKRIRFCASSLDFGKAKKSAQKLLRATGQNVAVAIEMLKQTAIGMEMQSMKEAEDMQRLPF